MFAVDEQRPNSVSIRSFNKLATHKGCLPIISLVLLLVMILGSARGCSGNNGPDANQAQPDTLVAKIGDYPIKAGMLKRLYDQEVQQMAQFMGNRPATAAMEADGYGRILGDQVRTALSLPEAANQHVPISDADIMKDTADEVDQSILSLKEQLIQAKRLTATASQKDFDAAYKAVRGVTPDEVRKQEKDALSNALKDPDDRAILAAHVAQKLVPKIMATRVKATDDDVRASYDALSVKQVTLNGPDGQKTLAKAEADLKAGSSFETVMDRYTKDPGLKGKKPSDVENTVTHEMLQQPENAPLLKLKPGEVSEPIQTMGGTIIYKLIKKTSTLPKDFEKNKATLTKQYADGIAQKQYSADIEALQKKTPIKWNDQGWKLLYEFTSPSTSIGETPTQRVQRLTQEVDSALKLGNTLPAALTAYLAATALSRDPGVTDKAGANEKLSGAIRAAAQYVPGPDLQLQLASICIQQKDGKGLAEALNTAASQNTDYTETGQGTWGQIEAMVHSNKTLLSPADTKTIEDAQEQWQNQKAEQAKQAAEAKKAADEQKKELEKEKKDFEKEKKDAAAKGTKVDTSKSGPSTPPPTPPTTPATPPKKQ